MRYLAVPDQPAPPPWEVVRPPADSGQPAIDSRRWKLAAGELFPDADWTIYHDGQLQLAVDPLALLAECEAWGPPETDLFLWRHQDRDCLYAEAAEVQRIDKDPFTADRIPAQIDRYRRDGVPEANGLYLGGMLIRRGRGACAAFERAWWGEVAAGSHRDQISLPVALERSGVAFAALPAMWWSHFLLRHKHGV